MFIMSFNSTHSESFSTNFILDENGVEGVGTNLVYKDHKIYFRKITTNINNDQKKEE